MYRQTAQLRYGIVLKSVGLSPIKVHCSGNTVKPVHSTLLHDELDSLAYTLKSVNEAEYSSSTHALAQHFIRIVTSSFCFTWLMP